MAKAGSRPKGYRSLIDEARKLKRESVAQDVSFLVYLVDLERTPTAWKRHKRDTFKEVVEGEALAPWGRYRRFRAAWKGGMARKDVRLFGVEATCRLMGFNAEIRKEAIEVVRGYCERRKGRPTYQWINARLSEALTGKSAYQKRKDRLTTNLAALAKHIDKLERLLRRNQLAVPLRPELL